MWHYLMPQIVVNIDSGYGLLHGGDQPLSDLMLTYRFQLTTAVDLTALSSPMAPWVVMTTTCDATGDGRPRALLFSVLYLHVKPK